MTSLAVVAVVLALTPAQLLPPLPPLPPPPIPLPPPPELCLLPPLPPICLPPEPVPPSDDPPIFEGKLTAERKSRYVRLRWPLARDDVGLAGYRIYRDGNYLGRRGPLVLTVRLVIPCGSHRYRIEAVDSAGQTASLVVHSRRRCN
jgi:hypothetical protein